MGFWSKLGKVFRVVRRGGQVAAPFVGKNVPVLNTVMAAVDLVEGLGPGTGEKKKSLATGIALNALKTVEGLAGRDLCDEEKVAASLGPLIDLVVEYRNLTSWKAAGEKR
jgi:hypothetical protein